MKQVVPGKPSFDFVLSTLLEQVEQRNAAGTATQEDVAALVALARTNWDSIRKLESDLEAARSAPTIQVLSDGIDEAVALERARWEAEVQRLKQELEAAVAAQKGARP